VIRRLLESPTEFLEVTIRERRVRVAQGPLGTRGLVAQHHFAELAELREFLGSLVATRLATGWIERAYEESYACGAREAGLEAAIAQAPDDPGAYLVYADWLLQREEPRGELIVAQHGELQARARELLDAHLDRFVGPLVYQHDARVEWYCGFVRGLELPSGIDLDTRALVALLQHASCAVVKKLRLRCHGRVDLAALAEHAPSTLRWLELDGQPTDLDPLRRRLAKLPPRLLGVEHLVVRNRTYRSVAEWLADGPS
jgi:uncharacterized protein (TIGR02996 family)